MQLNLTFKELINREIIHRDIKLENILIKYSNQKKTNFDSFLTDYGKIKDYGDNIEMSSIKIGTFGLVALEVKTIKNLIINVICLVLE